MERRAWIVAAAAGLVVAAASGWGLWRWTTTHRETEPVLVMLRTVPALQRITEADVGWRDLPRGARQPGTLQDPRQVVGRLARETLLAGDQIRPERLTEAGLELGPGERAVAVPSGLIQSVGGSLAPGDVVDAFWVTTKDQPARLVAVGAVVLDLRQRDGLSLLRERAAASLAQAVAGQIAPQPQGGENVPEAVVLKVRARNLPGLARALAEGRIVLAKSRPGEGDEVWRFLSEQEQPPEAGTGAPNPPRR